MQKDLGQYRILERLGSGAMGEVYVAQDTKLGRKIAIKMLPPEVADSPEKCKNLEREARIVASLNHPNIVTLHSVEEAEGSHFITMELVEGTTLTSLLPAMTQKRFFDLAIPLADAMGTAHRHGMVHRDLKPENIMVNEEGRPKVLDFGLAKLTERLGETPIDEMATPEHWHRRWDGGNVPPRIALIKETLDWFDLYVGPVEPVTTPSSRSENGS